MAARGIHIKNLKYVVNYDFPTTLEQYCHRIGRTGRQGHSGIAYSLITRNMAPLAKDLITLLHECDQVPEKNLLALADEITIDDDNGKKNQDSNDETYDEINSTSDVED